MDVTSDGRRYPFRPLLFEAPTVPVVVRVIRVVDGDTIVIEKPSGDDGDEHIRLYGIDAPEKRQPYGMEATEALEAIIAEQPERQILLRRYGIDGYGRTLGSLSSVGNASDDINQEMIKRGWAWSYSSKHDKVKPPFRYGASELEARFLRRGLWQGATPQNPSDFRAQKRAESARTSGSGSGKNKKKRKHRRHRSNSRSGSDSE